MKKVFTLLAAALLTAGSVLAQTGHPDAAGTPGTYTITHGRIKILQNLFLPTSKNWSLFDGQVLPGALMFNSTLNRVGVSMADGSFMSFPYLSELNAYQLKGNYQAAGDYAFRSDLSAYQPKGSYLTAETDPLFKASPAFGITAANITNWATAYSWGNHAGLYKPIGYVPAWTEITGKPTFATVSTSGSYTDLLNKPVIPAAQIQSDWNQAATTSLDYIKNKPVVYTQSQVDALLAAKENTANKVTTYSSTNNSTTQFPSMAALQSALNNVVLKGASVVVSATVIAAGSVNYTVTFATPFADNNYQAVAFFNTTNINILNSITLTISSKTASSCVVTIKNAGVGLSLSNSSIDVIALKTQ